MRCVRSLTQKELAERIDLNLSAIQRIEKGSKPITGLELVRLVDCFGVTTDYIMGITSCTTMISDEDLEILALYHNSPEHIQRTVKEMLQEFDN